MKFFAIGFAVFLLVGCGSKATDSEPNAVIADDAPRWDNPERIPICFTNRTAVDQEIYNDLLNTAVTQFARAGVYFSKWRDCDSQDYREAVIRVKFKVGHDWSGNGSYSFGGGKSKVGKTRRALEGENGATLWIRLDNHYPSQNGRKRATVMAATRSALLHEIGHALGLLHEHTRTDYRPEEGECRAAANHDNVREDPDHNDYIGRPDYDSVMSYCNLTADELSRGDIAGIHALYPELRN